MRQKIRGDKKRTRYLSQKKKEQTTPEIPKSINKNSQPQPKQYPLKPNPSCASTLRGEIVSWKSASLAMVSSAIYPKHKPRSHHSVFFSFVTFRAFLWLKTNSAQSPLRPIQSHPTQKMPDDSFRLDRRNRSAT